MRMIRRRRIHIEAIGLDRHFLRLIAEPAKFSVKIVSNRSLIAADGLDVHELPRKRNSVHGGENSREEIEVGRRTSDFRPRPAQRLSCCNLERDLSSLIDPLPVSRRSCGTHGSAAQL